MNLQELFATRSAWNKEKFALDKNNQSTFVEGPEAVSWCLAGGIYKCYEGEALDDVFHKVKLYIKGSVVAWNDHPNTTFEDVVKLCKELEV